MPLCPVVLCPHLPRGLSISKIASITTINRIAITTISIIAIITINIIYIYIYIYILGLPAAGEPGLRSGEPLIRMA